MNSTASPTSDDRAQTLAAWLSVAVNLCLALGKTAVGAMSGSISVLSDGLHSISDLLASVVTLIAVRIAQAPPDLEHPFGHGKAEPLSALAQAVFLLVAAVYIVWEAMGRLRSGVAPQFVDAAIVTMAATAVIKGAAAWYVGRTGMRQRSQALNAEAVNHRVDAITALGVVAGLALVRWTGRGGFDALAALAVAALIVREVWSTARRAIDELMDRRAARSDVQRVRQVIEGTRSVQGYHRIRARWSGRRLFVEAHLEFDPDMTLEQAHQEVMQLKGRLAQALPHVEATFYAQPLRRT